MEYSVTYVLNGGKNVAGNPATYTVESDLVLQDPVRDGYAFKGWFTSETGGDRVVGLGNGKTGDLTLYARWETQVFTVTFYAGVDGEEPKTQSVVSGGTAAFVRPEREGYLFVAWYTDEARTQEYDFADAVTDDLALYAGWRLASISATLEGGATIVVQSNTGFDEGTRLCFSEVTDDDPLKSAQASLADNMTIGKLYDISIVDANGDPIAIEGPITVCISLDGLGEAEGSYGIVYIPDDFDGEGVEELAATLQDGKLYFHAWHFSMYAVVDIVPVAGGFAWWWILVAVAGCAVLVLIAVLLIRANRRYELTYVNGGVAPLKLKESALVEMPIPVREDEVFDGWYYDEAFNNPAMITAMPKQNLILYAKWRRITDAERAAREQQRHMGEELQEDDPQ